jgi:hypothetical protein
MAVPGQEKLLFFLASKNLTFFSPRDLSMAKPQHKIKKANHGRRPASAKARKAKRRKIKT